MPEERLLTYSAALNEALRQEMEADPSVFVMGEDVAVWGDGGGVFGVTKGLVERFGPDRVRDTPISEEGIVAMGVGSALTGMRPVVELMYFDFVTLAMEPLVNQAAKLRYMSGGQASVPLVVRSNVGASGGKAAQHSQSLETWLAHVPGLKVVMPGTAADAKGLLLTAIRDPDPVVFLEHKLLYFARGDVPEEPVGVPFGSAAVRRPGRDVTVVAFQTMADLAVRAADELAAEGIEAEVIDPRTLVPLDVDAIVASVRRTNRLLVCHEAPERCGWAGEVAMQVMAAAFDDLDAPIGRVCGANVPVPYSGSLEPEVVPGQADVEAGIRAVVAGVSLDAVERRRRLRTATGGGLGATAAPAPTPTVTGRIVMPRLSDTMTEGVVARWLKAVGDVVRAGEPVVEVETDKTTTQLAAPVAGCLVEIRAVDGDAVPVGEGLGVVA